MIGPVPPASPSLRRRDDLGAILRDALLLELESPMNEEALLARTEGLIRALADDGIPHVLVGGLALLQYLDGRNTRDIDLILAVEDLPRSRISRYARRTSGLEPVTAAHCGSTFFSRRIHSSPMSQNVTRNRELS